MSADVVPQNALTCSTDGPGRIGITTFVCQPCRYLPCSSTRPLIKHHTTRVTILRRSRPGFVRRRPHFSFFFFYRRLKAISKPLASCERLLLLLLPSSICLNLQLPCGKPCIVGTERGVQLRPRPAAGRSRTVGGGQAGSPASGSKVNASSGRRTGRGRQAGVAMRSGHGRSVDFPCHSVARIERRLVTGALAL